MSEYAGTRLASAVRFAADTLNGVPSIVIGVFVYGIVVLQMRQFSMLAGSVALGVMMIPIIARTTEELLRLVPQTLREGALALGATRARATFSVVLPAALPGIITGVILALARIAGETAPLLFHVVQQSILEYQSTAADGITDGADLHLCELALRGLAPAGVGRRAGAGQHRAHLLDSGAHGDAPARADEYRQLACYLTATTLRREESSSKEIHAPLRRGGDIRVTSEMPP